MQTFQTLITPQIILFPPSLIVCSPPLLVFVRSAWRRWAVIYKLHFLSHMYGMVIIERYEGIDCHSMGSMWRTQNRNELTRFCSIFPLMVHIKGWRHALWVCAQFRIELRIPFGFLNLNCILIKVANRIEKCCSNVNINGWMDGWMDGWME